MCNVPNIKYFIMIRLYNHKGGLLYETTEGTYEIKRGLLSYSNSDARESSAP